MKWRKLGRVFVPDGRKPWARTHAYLPTPVVQGDVIRVYSASLDESNVGRVGYVDLDPADPTRVLAESEAPVLDVGELGCFDDNGVNPSSIIDWNGRMWMYYIGWQHAKRVPYLLFGGAAASSDGGRSFERVQRVPVLDRIDAEPFSRSAPFVLAGGESDTLRMWYWSCRHWTPVEGSVPHYNNSISYAESRDGITWTDVRSGILDPAEGDYAIGRPWVVRDGSLYRMWFGARSLTHRVPYRIDYAESRDGLMWTRKEPGITVSESGWDSEMVCFAAVIEVNGRRLLFYNGNRHGATGFGVAELESD